MGPISFTITFKSLQKSKMVHWKADMVLLIIKLLIQRKSQGKTKEGVGKLF